jgi:hypothetical protein
MTVSLGIRTIQRVSKKVLACLGREKLGVSSDYSHEIACSGTERFWGWGGIRRLALKNEAAKTRRVHPGANFVAYIVK